MIGQKLTSKYQTTIPKEVREYLGLKAGDTVLFVRKGEDFIVQRANLTLHDFVGKFEKQEGVPDDWDDLRQQARREALKKKGLSRD